MNSDRDMSSTGMSRIFGIIHGMNTVNNLLVQDYLSLIAYLPIAFYFLLCE